MKHVRVEDGVVVGTSGNKYGVKNPVARRLLRGFDDAVRALLRSVSVEKVLEIGCGEGHVTELLLEISDAEILATDISSAVLEETEQRIKSDRIRFQVGELENLKIDDNPELIVCCEVLEHLPNPGRGLQALSGFGAAYYLLSVPREPIWRLLNMSRGAYLAEWGNSPGHVQHWSKSGFISFIEQELKILEVRSPLPWTVLLCSKH